MADILPFKAPAVKKTGGGKIVKSKGKGSTLCRQGHHKWRVVTEQKFDVKQGRLVTVLECVRCKKRQIKAI